MTSDFSSTQDKRQQLKDLLYQRAYSRQPGSSAASSVIEINGGGDKTPLFCVHGGGAGLNSYKRLASYLGGDRRIFGLQTVGATADDPVIRNITALATMHLTALRACRIQGPYMLCGHSMGAIVALEMAQQLTRDRQQVELLVIIDQPGPDIDLSFKDWLYWQWAAISHLTWRQRNQYLINSLRYRLATSQRVPVFARRLFFSKSTNQEHLTGRGRSAAEYRRRMTDASIEALKNYHAEPYPAPMALFRAESSAPRLHADSMGGWGRISRQQIQVFEIPGHHMNIFQPPHVSVFGEKLKSCLDRCTNVA